MYKIINSSSEVPCTKYPFLSGIKIVFEKLKLFNRFFRIKFRILISYEQLFLLSSFLDFRIFIIRVLTFFIYFLIIFTLQIIFFIFNYILRFLDSDRFFLFRVFKETFILIFTSKKILFLPRKQNLMLLFTISWIYTIMCLFY